VPARLPTTIGVVVVNFNTRDYLRACLASIEAERPNEIVVVDNASHDGSVDMVRSEYPRVRLICNQTNVGYGAAANQAFALCTSDYVLLLNSDTQVTTGSLTALANYIDQHSQVAIVGPKLLNADGTVQTSCFHFHTPFQTLIKETSLHALIARVPVLRERYLPTSSHDRVRTVPWVLGAALMVRRAAFESVGGFDTRFFMYSEEVDLCYRLCKAGWQTHFAPVATILHVGEASTSQRRVEMGVKLYRSMRLFYELHYGVMSVLQFKMLLLYVVVRNLVLDGIRLRCARQASDRATILGNIAIWKRVLADTFGSSRGRWQQT
jgi:GT2 family glycosyltransferase